MDKFCGPFIACLLQMILPVFNKSPHITIDSRSSSLAIISSIDKSGLKFFDIANSLIDIFLGIE